MTKRPHETSRVFPHGFLWGAATAAAQIEGAADADGRTPSVWDVHARRPGATADGQTPAEACDHYHRVAEDVALMREIGLKAYRFSIAWPRIVPEADGRMNPAGVAFYRRLVGLLRDAGIEPVVTLFHWDMPMWLYERGGWLNRESTERFADYAEAMARALPEVTYWVTHNEPVCCCEFGHRTGQQAPGDRHDWPAVLRVAHHLLLSHGLATRRVREAAPHAKIGLVNTAGIRYPADPGEPDDVEAARLANFRTRASLWGLGWWSDPAYLGHYPEDGLREFGHHMPEGFERDLATIHAPLDYYGLNLYTGEAIRGLRDDRGDLRVEPVPFPVGHPRSPVGWDEAPDAMYWGVRYAHERYRLPVLLAENGIVTNDGPSLDGRVHDPGRIDYTQRYLRRLRDAVHDGVPVLGYMHWSLMDNFEWAHGYRARFGLTYVDYATQERILKDSARWYRRVILTRGASLEETDHGWLYGDQDPAALLASSEAATDTVDPTVVIPHASRKPIATS